MCLVVVVIITTTITTTTTTSSPLCRVFTLIYLKQTVSRVYCVAAILRILLMVYITLSSILNSFVPLHQHFLKYLSCAQYYYYYYYY
jgi:hypothetical protein